MMHEPNHPIWLIIRITVVMLSLVAILALTAQHFDESEIKSLIFAFAAIAGIEGVINLVNRNSSGK